jgi:hypothetical protein
MWKHIPLLVAALGFILIVINAADYLGGYNQLSGGNTIIGLMLVVLGMFMGKRERG